MDASPLPVLSRWTDAVADASAGAAPPELTGVDGLAPSAGDALRRAVALWPGRDVLVLHARTILPPDGWRRLAAAWRDGDWDVLSPATIAVAPDAGDAGFRVADADADAWTRAEHVVDAHPTWDPHCVLWRGGVPIADGLPLRIGRAGCIVVGVPAASDAARSASGPAAGNAAAAPDIPIGGADDADDAAPRGRAARPHVDVILHVLHGWGGGAERFVRDLGAHDTGRTHLVLIAHNREDRPPLGERFALHHDLDAAPLREWTPAVPIADSAEDSAEVQAILAEIVAEWGVGAVLVSSLIGHALDVLRTGLPTAVCFHDAYPLWPLLHDERDPRVDPFDAAALAAGLAAEPTPSFRGRDAVGWQRFRDAFLAALVDADALLVAPSRFARERLIAIEPELREHRWQVIGHGLAPFAMRDPADTANAANAANAASDTDATNAADAASDTDATNAAGGTPRPLRVLVPGRVHGGKGERLLDALLPQLPPGIELLLLGAGRAGERFRRDGVRVVENYARDELPELVAAYAPDLALLPSTVPETFGYTLSEMLALGVPVLSASPGAPAERLAAHGGGWVVAPDATAVAAELARLAADRDAIAAMRATRPPLDDATAMADAWRLALSVAPAPLRLPPAEPALLRLRALRRAHARLRSQARRAAEDLEHARRELITRAEWAHDLQRQIDRARTQLAVEEAELDSRAGWARDLQAQLDQARERLQHAHAELDQRAQWAHSLQRQLDDAGAALADALAQRDAARAGEAAALAAARAEKAAVERERAESRRRLADAEEHELELRRLDEYIRELDHQLAEAHGYYQRDSTDLARQRDVAIGQRDQALAELGRMKHSIFWRITAWPRALANALRDRFAAGAYRERYLRQLIGRGVASLRTRGLAGTWQRLKERRAQGRGDAAPIVGPSPTTTGELVALRLPQPRAPRASVIVPVYNQLSFSLACLRALADCGDAAPFEVIVVDDHSSDATPRVLPSIPGLRYHRNARNLGFIGACNAGAEIARGDFVVFLNNDTTVQPGWLDALLATFADYPDTGLAGSKLVYPDGRLQEAGGIVFADGSGWNYGRFDDPADPRYGFVREVDYCSGAAIALPRTLFMALGGFDAHYAPAYYEDTDLAMRVRQGGRKVRYQPASVVVHHEGVTSGTDVREGIKAYQVANHAKFRERWDAVLRAEHLPAGSPPELAADRGRGPRRGRRVLVLDACTPTPDRDSGSVRMFALMRVLREQGCSVVFFAENRAHDGRYSEALQQIGVEVWWHPWLADVPRWLATHGAEFDLVIASRHYVLGPLLPLLRRHAARAHLVFDTVDLHHLREQREAELGDDPARWRAAARTRRTELALIRAADTTWVVSEAERVLLAKDVPEARVEVVSNIHDVHGPGPDWHARAGLLFVGSYRHPPNVDAARWLVDEILPHVHARLPGVELHLVGGDAPEEVQAFGERPGVRFHGYVPDLLPLLQGARIGVAPLRYGAGVKGKVNQSLAHGLPMVATTCAVEGMHLHDGEDVLVGDDAESFAAAIVRLHEDRELWRRLAAGGLENTRRHFSTDAVRTTLQRLLDTLPGSG